MIYLYLLFCLYASIEGVTEGILYGKQGAESFKWNEHIVYVCGRGVVLTGFLLAPELMHFSLEGFSVLALICFLSYSFFHDGFYYETARRINRPDYKFNSNSKTSTAKIEITWAIRLSMFVASLIILIIYRFILQKF